jgi:transposase
MRNTNSASRSWKRGASAWNRCSWRRSRTGRSRRLSLISPQYVRPFVKRQKNDAADAEAIAIAARQPEMRFVEAKTPDQQARAVLFRAWERIIRQRTELVNALRAVLYEFGQTVPQGIVHIKRLAAIIGDKAIDLPDIVREECRDLLAQIDEKTVRIEAKTKRLTEFSRKRDSARRLQTMPGVGPMIALAVEAFAPAMATFRCGRDFAAWLGLVSRQFSSGARSGLAAYRRQVRPIYADF